MNTKQSNTEYQHKSAFASKEDLFRLAFGATVLTWCSIFRVRSSLKLLIPFINAAMGFIQRGNNPYDAYTELCQRILLARRMHIKSRIPAYWFKKHFDETVPLYQTMLKKRKADPLYMHSLKWLAEAILDICENPDTGDVRYWMNWFRNNNATNEIKVFVKAANMINPKYKKDANNKNEDNSQYKRCDAGA